MAQDPKQAENCTPKDCGSCSKECSSRKGPQSFLAEPHAGTKVKKVIGVVSGKGGVGKSMMTALLSVAAQRNGKKVGIMDADITGPSIPKMFGIEQPGLVEGDENGMFPATTKSGIKAMSMNLLLETSDTPVIWRGPVIMGVVKQFWTDFIWGDLDYMFVDMPPGTGDVPLTVFQSLPVDGIVVVTSPQDLVATIVGKAVNMAEMMNVPILGIVENMSYLECPDCGKKIYVFGEGKTDEAARKYGIEKIAKLPILPELASLSDEGRIEEAPEAVANEIYRLLQ